MEVKIEINIHKSTVFTAGHGQFADEYDIRYRIQYAYYIQGWTDSFILNFN